MPTVGTARYTGYMVLHLSKSDTPQPDLEKEKGERGARPSMTTTSNQPGGRSPAILATPREADETSRNGGEPGVGIGAGSIIGVGITTVPVGGVGVWGFGAADLAGPAPIAGRMEKGPVRPAASFGADPWGRHYYHYEIRVPGPLSRYTPHRGQPHSA